MWNLLPSERLRYWQDFRQSINTKSLEEAVKDTQHLWSYAPFQTRYLSRLPIDKWPNPWELIYENQYCDLAKALGIVYTLYLTNHCPELEIVVYNAPLIKDPYNLVFVDKGKYILNYIHDEVVNNTQLQKDLEVKNIIHTGQLGLDKFK
jgi:hypothetical protein